MRVLVYSDVHGNLPAFESILKEAGNCDLYVCLGDLVNYGPWSNECVDLAISLPNSIILSGNHEEAFIKGSYPGDNKLVQDFFDICIKDFDRKKEIEKFIDQYTLGDFVCRHTILNQYIYPDTHVSLDDNYLIGHSHHQFEYHNKGFTLYNCGSVGQNRKVINVANYIIYDLEKNKIHLKSTVYPFDKLIKEMRDKKYPLECLNYYLQKGKQ
ncbi:MAG: hypothetical protein JWO58_506 [Chitinophagaceae bacterium]|nr:hypothetical protein [Chitinophagaceae bacterium]